MEASFSERSVSKFRKLIFKRFQAYRARLWISLFLSTLETTIVSTSLVSITNALNGFILRDWIVTSYLLTYTGKHIISVSWETIS